MNRGPVIFLGTLLAFALSFFAFVLFPQVQVGRQPLAAVLGAPDGTTYPAELPGQARQGAMIYQANGCAACHSQQVRQTGVNFKVMLAEAGTNTAAVLTAVMDANPKLDEAAARALLQNTPATVLPGLSDKKVADAAQKALKNAGAKAEIKVEPTGPDIARAWGARRTVAADYLFDSPVQLGAQRVGPDLANVGLRYPDANWQLVHLYNPQIYAAKSPMPPYKFLFHLHKVEAGAQPSPDALTLPAEFAPPAGYEVIPTDDARALVAYLLSRKAVAPVFDAPLSVAQAATPATNAVAGGTNAASATNAVAP
ncbi:MAG TPA: ribosomal protein L7/L12 [Dongiaceae bacterium]|jgi:ribosomal protein L7/L12|nr:ribosomal protein L7/L12 [Dongiaceae bacterium]